MMSICMDKQYKYTLLKVSSKIKLIAMHKTSAGEKRKALKAEALELARDLSLIQKLLRLYAPIGIRTRV